MTKYIAKPDTVPVSAKLPRTKKQYLIEMQEAFDQALEKAASICESWGGERTLDIAADIREAKGTMNSKVRLRDPLTDQRGLLRQEAKAMGIVNITRMTAAQLQHVIKKEQEKISASRTDST